MAQEKMSPLRARMIEDMRIRRMAETSQKAHIRALKDFEPPRVYRRVVGSNVRLLFHSRSRPHRSSPLLLAA